MAIRHQTLAIGLDFGTTNTTVASFGRPIPLGETGSVLLPSALAFLPSGTTVIGEPARMRRAIDPPNTLLSIKRVIGAPPSSSVAKSFIATMPYFVGDIHQDELSFRTRGGAFRASEIAKMIIAHAFALADVSPLSVSVLVVGVPTSYTPERKQVLLNALQSLGFAKVHLIEEPVLTAVAYVGRSSVRRALVFDFGGGTFDVAVIDGTRHPFRVLAQGGDPYLGGNDIDLALAMRLREQLLRATGWDLGSNPVVLDRLVHEVEQAKMQLAYEESTLIQGTDLDPAAPISVGAISLDRATLAEVARPFVMRALQITEEVLEQARVTPREIDAIFLSGGSTRLAVLRESLVQRFGKRLRHDVDPACTVAIGASLLAARPELLQAFVGSPS
ncbi:MAG: Hsp70 family protein [Deltaproteobacteria bacterium]|nr:Hsp70 family protein [Deltaproteobacteria bacterium]